MVAMNLVFFRENLLSQRLPGPKTAAVATLAKLFFPQDLCRPRLRPGSVKTNGRAAAQEPGVPACVLVSEIC